MKRLSVLVLHNRKNCIYTYIQYLAKDLRSISEKLVIVYNGFLLETEMEKLKDITPYCFCRENKGYDSGAYKDVICNYLGWEEVSKYDELVLCNDTFFGPFYGFQSIFNDMESKTPVDFWGITLHRATSRGTPEHIQSYFIVFTKTIITSKVFKEYWEKLKYASDYDEARSLFETRITGLLSEHGYQYDTYVKEETGVPYNGVTTRPFYYISKLRCPILKKKRFVEDFPYSDELKKAVQYVTDNTPFDSSMIWECITNEYSIGEIDKGYHLRYILPSNGLNSTNNATHRHIIARIDYANEGEYYLAKLEDCSKYIDVDAYIYNVNSNHVSIDGINVHLNENEFRAWLQDYIQNIDEEIEVLFINNERKTSDVVAEYAEREIQDSIWDNMVLSGVYVNYLFSFLQRRKEIGLAIPFLNYDAYTLYDIKSAIDYRKSIELVRSDVEPKDASDIIQGRYISEAFCVKGSLLSVLNPDEIVKNYFHPLHEKKLVATVLIHSMKSGYIPVSIESSSYAERVANCNWAMDDNGMIDSKLGLDFMIKSLTFFCKCFKKVYIYGAGEMAIKLSALMKTYKLEYDGHVVSSTDGNDKFLLEHQVISINDIEPSNDVGIILGMGMKNKQLVVDGIKERGFTNIFY